VIIKNEKNYGFAEGNNIGIRYAMKAFNPEYVLLLNNDTVVDPRFLSELIKVGESDEKIGILGSKIYYYNYNGRDDVIWFLGGKINWLRYPGYSHTSKRLIDSYEFANKILESDWISGKTPHNESLIKCYVIGQPKFH